LNVVDVRSKTVVRVPTLLLLSGLATSVAVLLGVGGPRSLALLLVLVAVTSLLGALVKGSEASNADDQAPSLLPWGRRLLAVNWLFTFMAVVGDVIKTTRSMALGGLFVALLLLSFILGWDTVRSSPRLFGGRSPFALVVVVTCTATAWLVIAPVQMDVLMFQELGSQRLLAGVNPYSPPYPDIYPTDLSRQFYGEGVSIGGQLQFGFPYPPASLLLVLPGHLLGDVRVVHVVVGVLTGAMLLFMVPRSAASRLAGVLFLTSPLLLFIVQHGWTETLLAGALVSMMFAWRRGWLVWAGLLGLAAVLKQYAVAFLPVILVNVRRRASARALARPVGVALATAGLATVPFFVWGPADFLASVVELHLRQPFREDSLSFLAASVRLADWPPPALRSVPTLLGTVVALAFVLLKAPRRSWGVGAGCALVMFGFVALSKQAFANYYFLIFALTCLALASWEPRPEARRLEGRREVVQAAAQ
jgi:hypothetical protein